MRLGTLLLAITSGLFLTTPGMSRADELEGTLTGHCRCRCYNPCEPVGPIRRFFRHVFLPPCPPRCAVPVAVVPAPAPVACVPFPSPAAGPVAPPATLDQPTPVPPPSGGGPFRPELGPPSTGSSYPRLTPPTPELPIRADRIASTDGTSGALQGQVVLANRVPAGNAEVILVSARRADLHQRIAANQDGQFGIRLATGEWLVYTRNNDGQWVPHGRVEVQEHQTAKVTIIEP